MIDSIRPADSDRNRFKIVVLCDVPAAGVTEACGSLDARIRLRTCGRGEETFPRAHAEFFEFVLGQGRCLGHVTTRGVISRGGHHQAGESQEGHREDN